jgi:hypothetical protein
LFLLIAVLSIAEFKDDSPPLQFEENKSSESPGLGDLGSNAGIQFATSFLRFNNTGCPPLNFSSMGEQEHCSIHHHPDSYDNF